VAFGTGAHPTTQLCLESLEMRLMNDTAKMSPLPILAVGPVFCPSGRCCWEAKKPMLPILTIWPFMLQPPTATLNNLAAERMPVIHGSLDAIAQTLDEPVDGLVCNILAEVILDLIPKLDTIVAPQGWGILSGILLEQSKLVADTLEQHGWVVATLWRRQEWCCLNVRRA
jgi:ribosomal protein L11 methyltransferase